MRSMRCVLLLLCLMLLNSPVGAQRRMALLIADGEHLSPSIPPLPSARHDVRLMASLLTWRYGFKPAEITLIGLAPGEIGPGYRYLDRRDARHGAQPPTRQHATSDMVKQALVQLRRQAQPEDEVVVYLSGHGARRADPQSPTFNTEWVITYDGAIRDLLLKQWVAAIPAKRTTLIVDACFSGGTTRAWLKGKIDGETYTLASKALPPDLFLPEEDDHNPLVPRDPGVRLTLLTACSEEETAGELQFREGAIAISGFTWALYHVLMNHPEPLSPPALSDLIRERLKATHCIQHPVIRLAAGTAILFPSNGPAWRSPRFPLAGAGTNTPALAVGYFAGIHSGMRLRGATFTVLPASAGPDAVVNRIDWFSATLGARRGPWQSAHWAERTEIR